MRIVGDIPHPTFKITIFLHDDKFILKIETGLYEQTYKFRSGTKLQNVAEVKALIDAPFLAATQEVFKQMHLQRLAVIERNRTNEADEFEEII